MAAGTAGREPASPPTAAARPRRGPALGSALVPRRRGPDGGDSPEHRAEICKGGRAGATPGPLPPEKGVPRARGASRLGPAPGFSPPIPALLKRVGAGPAGNTPAGPGPSPWSLCGVRRSAEITASKAGRGERCCAKWGRCPGLQTGVGNVSEIKSAPGADAAALLTHEIIFFCCSRFDF